MGRETVHFQAPDSEVLVKEMNTFLTWFNNEEKIDALRDVNDLIEKGMLTREAPGSKSTSYAVNY